MQCSGPKKSPRTTSIVQIVFSFWSFESSHPFSHVIARKGFQIYLLLLKDLSQINNLLSDRYFFIITITSISFYKKLGLRFAYINLNVLPFHRGSCD